MTQNEVIDDFVKMSKMLEEKDQCIKELEQQLTIYKRALGLACEKYIDVDGISYVLGADGDYFCKSDEQVQQVQKETIAYFISQAKKELEEEDVKD